MMEVTIIGDWNGLKCVNCNNWIPIEAHDIDNEPDCCEKPDYKQHETPVASLEEMKNQIQIQHQDNE